MIPNPKKGCGTVSPDWVGQMESMREVANGRKPGVNSTLTLVANPNSR